MELSEVIAYAIAAIGGGWALFKTVVERRLKANLERRRAELDAQIAAQADEREHRQQIEDKERTFEQLQRSWQADSVTELLHQDQEFIRGVIVARLDDLDKRLRILEETTAQSRDTLANVWRIANELKSEMARFKAEIISALKNILLKVLAKK